MEKTNTLEQAIAQLAESIERKKTEWRWVDYTTLAAFILYPVGVKRYRNHAKMVSLLAAAIKQMEMLRDEDEPRITLHSQEQIFRVGEWFPKPEVR